MCSLYKAKHDIDSIASFQGIRQWIDSPYTGKVHGFCIRSRIKDILPYFHYRRNACKRVQYVVTCRYQLQNVGTETGKIHRSTKTQSIINKWVQGKRKAQSRQRQMDKLPCFPRGIRSLLCFFSWLTSRITVSADSLVLLG